LAALLQQQKQAVAKTYSDKGNIYAKPNALNVIIM
jgi:hypothetical protein